MSEFCALFRKEFPVVTLVLLVASQSFAEIDLSGYVNSYHAVRSVSPNDYLASRVTLRGELEGYTDWGGWFTSLNIEKNEIIPEKDGFECREAFLNYNSDLANLKIGRQLIIWGKADGIQITDVVSPKDMTEFLARDYDEIRVPVDAFSLQLYKSCHTLELVFVPVFQSSTLPPAESPWSASQKNTSISVIEEVEPAKTITNSEYGFRYSAYASGIDYSFSLFRHWNDIPTFRTVTTSNNQEIILTERFLSTMMGVDLSKPVSDFVFRGEFAYHSRSRLLKKTDRTKLVDKPVLDQLLGIDWYPGSDWTISGQLNNRMILDHTSQIVDKENRLLGTLNISKKLLHNTLTLSSFAYVEFESDGIFNRFSGDYSLTDNIHLVLGYDLFHGDKGMFGQFEDNSEFWFQARYSF